MFNQDFEFIYNEICAAEIEKLCRYFRKASPAMVAEICKLQLAHQNRLLQKNSSDFYKGKRAELSFISLMYATQQMKELQEKLNKKSSWTAKEAEQLSQIRMENFKALTERKRKRTKADKVRVRHFELIKSLRNQGLSWQKVADYIALHHKERYSRSYLQKTFTELEKE
jgi:arginine utilization protein RocB